MVVNNNESGGEGSENEKRDRERDGSVGDD